MDSHLLPGVKPKLFGKYRGIVAIGKDPAGKGRIKVKIPALYGFKVLDVWAYPVLPPQFAGIDVQGTGRLQFDLYDATLKEPSMTNLALNDISESGSDLVPSSLHALTAGADSLIAKNTDAGITVRKKLPQIVPVDASTWEIPAGTGVWIEFEGGDPDKPIWCGFWK